MSGMALSVQKKTPCPIEVDSFYNCTSTRSLASQVHFTPIVDDATLQIFLTVNSLALNSLVMVLGVTTNIINIIVFTKLGFSDTTNISLLALTISDLASLLVKLPQIFLNPVLLPDDLTFNPLSIHYLAVGTPYTWLSRTTSWLTVYIVLERYLCVMIPLKVKSMITPRRSVSVIVIIYILMAISALPNYYTNRLEWTYNPSRNRTILGLTVTSDSGSVTSIALPIKIFLQVGSFFAVVALTSALVTKLAQKSEWRKKTAANPETFSHRDNRIAQMIIFICIIFIVCYIPMTIAYVWTAVDPEFSSVGRNKNLQNVFNVSATLAQSITSSINLFVYVKMSTKYREMFYSIFRRTNPGNSVHKFKTSMSE